MTGPAVVVVGSVNTDIDVVVDFFPAPGETVSAHSISFGDGGKGANAAVAAARAGSLVALIAAVGHDDAESTLAKMRHAGVDVSGVQMVSGRSGHAVAVRDSRGENLIFSYSGANSELSPEAVRDELHRFGSDVKVVLSNLEISDDAVLAAARGARDVGARFVLDPSPARPVSADILELCFAVVPNETEVDSLGLDRVTARPIVILTRGAHGVRISDASVTVEVEPFPADSIDTVGAGDAFAGAFVAALSEGKDRLEAVTWGAAAGALATQTVGARTTFQRRELDDLISNRSKTNAESRS